MPLVPWPIWKRVNVLQNFSQKWCCDKVLNQGGRIEQTSPKPNLSMLHLVTKSKKFHTIWFSRHLSPNTGSSDTKWLPTLTFPWNSTASPCKALAEFVPTSLALSNKVTQNFIPCRNVLGTFAVQGPSEVQELWWALNSDHSDLVWGTRFLTWLEGGGLWNWPQNSGEFGSGWVDPCHWCSHYGWGDEEPMGTSQLTLCHADPPKIQWFPQNCCPPQPLSTVSRETDSNLFFS